MSSKCRQCGEEFLQTGNYTFKIIPPKRIPKKARKLMTKGKAAHVSMDDATSFQKFLMKRAKPTNHIELTCGKCGTLSKIKMLKPDNAQKRTSTSCEEVVNPITSQPNAASSSGSRKRKRTKDKNAGLTIPTNLTEKMLATTSMVVNEQTSEKPRPSVPVPTPKPGEKRKSPFVKQKEMDKLKKILFDSKKAKKSGSSLQDFLSSI